MVSKTNTLNHHSPTLKQNLTTPLLYYSHQREKKGFKKPRSPISVHHKWESQEPTPRPQTTSVLSISSPHSTTHSFTSLICPVEKPTAESLVVWKSRPIEKNHPHMLVRNWTFLKPRITYANDNICGCDDPFCCTIDVDYSRSLLCLPSILNAICVWFDMF